MSNRFLITKIKYPNSKPNQESEFLIESEMRNLAQKITEEDQEVWEADEEQIRKNLWK